MLVLAFNVEQAHHAVEMATDVTVPPADVMAAAGTVYPVDVKKLV